jgi:hypothetical protein
MFVRRVAAGALAIMSAALVPIASRAAGHAGGRAPRRAGHRAAPALRTVLHHRQPTMLAELHAFLTAEGVHPATVVGWFTDSLGFATYRPEPGE